MKNAMAGKGSLHLRKIFYPFVTNY